MKVSTRPPPNGSDPALGTTLEFLQLIWALDHGLQARSKFMEAELGVSGLQRLAVRLVGRFPGIIAGDLSDMLRVHPSTLTGVLERLVRNGLVRRERDPQDKRRSQLWLTPDGEKINRVTVGTVEAAVARVLKDMTPADLRGAKRVLEKLAAELRPTS